ncbi:integrase [Pontibacter aydingkolensis]|uniref:Site-specific integrase n=1 Tax=Pontibacter aydingkolensis TaxID=1911536 RepID=A0ABS7CQF4_9BACT|nr:site-specific integrase [Pontibacter aydingkolensis]MBW7466013.1 site-specific integrase [Pontibacter aydingkolensis]
MQDAFTQIILDTRRALKDGSYPIKLRVTYQRKQKYYPTGINMSREEFEKMNSARPGRDLKDVKLELQDQEQKAAKVIEKLLSFSFEEFERRLQRNGSPNEVFSAFDTAIARLRKAGRAATADNYESARNSLRGFVSGKASTSRKGMTKKQITILLEEEKDKTVPLPFSRVTSDFLESYEEWMVQEGRSSTTVGIYLRPLRALFNEAIASGEVPLELYPFGKRKYQIPSGVNVKKALGLKDIQKIFDYAPATESEARNRDLWLFSYLCSGMNVKDMARLTYKQVEKETITFVRSKTARSTRQKQKNITVSLLREAEEIIQKWGNKPPIPESYIFPILTPGLTPEQELAKVKQATKTINKYMQRITKALKLEKDVTTYTARHSFSTVLKRSGAPTALISESLGHSSEKTTQHYLDSFEDETKRQYLKNLTAFAKGKE